MDVEAKVKEIIVQQLGVDADKVTPEASFVDDLGADSLDVVELVMAFEEEFEVEAAVFAPLRRLQQLLRLLVIVQRPLLRSLGQAYVLQLGQALEVVVGRDGLGLVEEDVGPLGVGEEASGSAIVVVEGPREDGTKVREVGREARAEGEGGDGRRHRRRDRRCD